MLNDLLGTIWRRTPRKLRTWAVRVTKSRFTVTAGAIVSDDAGRVLLLCHRFRPGSGWGMPGGFIEQGEQPEDALRRELREEVGLEIHQPKVFTARAFGKPKQIEIVFCCLALGETDQLNFEIKKAAWFYPHEMPKELPADQAELIKLALAHWSENT